MPRKPRVHYCGAFYHVMLRGNNKQEIFHSNRDRLRFYFLLQEACEKYFCKIHAFCLMSNHVHILMEVGEIPLSKCMQNIAFRYAGWMNKKKARVGHLFQGRYKALLVEKNSYLVGLVCYIHLNPFQANLIQSPDASWWSSHLCYLGESKIPWLTTDRVLGCLNDDSDIAVLSYKKIFHKYAAHKASNKKPFEIQFSSQEC